MTATLPTPASVPRSKEQPASAAVVAVARSTFDTELARELADAAAAVVGEVVSDVTGTGTLVTDPDAVIEAVGGWAFEPDVVVVLQATFTDSRFVAQVAAATSAPIVIWSFPDRRDGGRLRLNSLCGLTLAGYRLGLDARAVRHLHHDPRLPDATAALRGVLRRVAPPRPPIAEPPTPDGDSTAARAVDMVVARLERSRLGIIGEPPDGFEPCDLGAPAAARLGMSAVRLPIEQLTLIDPAVSTDGVRVELTSQIGGLHDLEPEEIEPSLRLAARLDELSEQFGLDAVATRCWPECFEDCHGAVCTALAHCAGHGIPGGCEADALGSVTLLVLQWLTGSPAFLADLVDIDPDDDTAVVWHCGVAPFSMASPQSPPQADRHPNRGIALTHEFSLRPGPATVARLSQSRGVLRMVVGSVDILDRPLPYRGTAGVICFGGSVTEALDTFVAEGLEHHLCIAHGDVHAELVELAARLGLPVVEL
jgi:L-fucose isomerase-like protein